VLCGACGSYCEEIALRAAVVIQFLPAESSTPVFDPRVSWLHESSSQLWGKTIPLISKWWWVFGWGPRFDST